MKAKLHSRKSCGHEWGQFIIHASAHTQTGVMIKTVQLFSSESRIKRLSTPRPMRTSDFIRGTRWTQRLPLSTVFARPFGPGLELLLHSCVVVLVAAVLSTRLLLFLMFASWSVMEELSNPGRFLMSIFFGPEGENLGGGLIALSPLLLSETVKEWGGKSTSL